MNLIFDTHAHYHDEAFDEDRQALITKLPELGVSAVINASTDLKTAKQALMLCSQYDFVFAGIGIHPLYVRKIEENYIQEMKKLILNNKVVCVGEIGLDYYHSYDNKEQQKKVFKEQIEFALEYNLPIAVHDREAHDDILHILKEYKPKGMIHCFSGDVSMAKEIEDINMYLSFGGMITYDKNSEKIRKVLSEISIEKMLIETDAPYLAPVPFRSKRCDSSLIPYTAKKIAEIRGISEEEVLWTTKENACDLFGVSFV